MEEDLPERDPHQVPLLDPHLVLLLDPHLVPHPDSARREHSAPEQRECLDPAQLERADLAQLEHPAAERPPDPERHHHRPVSVCPLPSPLLRDRRELEDVVDHLMPPLGPYPPPVTQARWETQLPHFSPSFFTVLPMARWEMEDRSDILPPLLPPTSPTSSVTQGRLEVTTVDHPLPPQ